jgi:hypothetical protein
MSSDPGELIALPVIIVMGITIVASVWIGGNGGDVTWIADAAATLVIPALIVGLCLAGGAAVLSKV